MKQYIFIMCLLVPGFCIAACHDASSKAAAGEPCDTNADCRGGLCAEGTCVSPVFSDGDDDAMSTDGDGEDGAADSFEDMTDITIQCTEDDRTCLMGYAMKCRRGMWIDPVFCDPGWKNCVDGECQSPRGTPEEPVECTKDDLRCNGNTVEICHLGRWRSHNNCSLLGMTCRDGACAYPPPQESCIPEELRCVGNSGWYCNAGIWELETVCEYGMMECKDGECVEYFDLCLAGTTICYDNIRYRCRLGEIVAMADCSRNRKICAELIGCTTPEELDPAHECTNGETRCDFDRLATCIGETWVVTADCSATGATCQNGACAPCAQGDRTCIGDTSWECVDGLWQYRQTCSLSGAVCLEGACLAPPSRVDLPLPCPQNTTACAGPYQYICLGSGWFLYQDCRDSNGACKKGMCLSDSLEGKLCPSGAACLPWHTGDYMCLTADGVAPENIPCTDNSQCADIGGLCVPESPSGETSICLKPCGVCPQGQNCRDVDAGGSPSKACFVNELSMPIEAPGGCTRDDQCPPSHICHCFNDGCSISACLRSCSL